MNSETQRLQKKYNFSQEFAEEISEIMANFNLDEQRAIARYYRIKHEPRYTIGDVLGIIIDEIKWFYEIKERRRKPPEEVPVEAKYKLKEIMVEEDGIMKIKTIQVKI